MKSLKYLFLMTVPVVLLSCGQSSTQNRANKNDGGMGGRDYNKVQTDKDRSGSQGIQSDTSKYRSGSGSKSTEGMGSQGSSTQQGSSSRSGSQGSSTQPGSSTSPSGSQGSSTQQSSTPRSGSQNSSTQQSSTPRSGSQNSSTQKSSTPRSGSQSNTTRSTNPDNSQVTPR